MKQNNEQVVFYSAENDGFLESYKDRILSLAQENNKLKRELWNLKKSKGRKWL